MYQQLLIHFQNQSTILITYHLKLLLKTISFFH
nr:MAG TPA: hypothetical protein [Caudoviricetes sp.]